ncbi:hypothetical protein TbrSNM41_24250 (plasmid) [Thermus brockianus]|uniref:Uncharacterized protein n=2 Tax=Thermus brockianus TaxID=56956 RepID=A0ABM7XMW1_THEBO|nr:hypothetical protein TbrSNM41_24250 [Thermus brockianus]
MANLGSREAGKMDFAREALWRRMDGAMGKKAVQIPVFLVNPRQMDYLYPPERMRFLHPEAVRRWAQERRKRRERNEGEPLQGLDLAPSDRYREVVAVGLYMHQLDGKRKEELLRLAEGDPEAEALQRHNGPAILLCPERILSWARQEGVNHNLVLDKVYYHELGHALMDTGPTPYGELWGRIIEESLANWVAYRRFRGQEARWVQRLIQGQPAEYQGYLAVEEGFVFLGDRETLEEWAWHMRRLWHRAPWDWEEWWYAWRHLWHELWERGYGFLDRGFPPLLPGLPLPMQEEAGASNFRLWREAKRQEWFKEPDVVRAYAGFAEELLLRAVD